MLKSDILLLHNNVTLLPPLIPAGTSCNCNSHYGCVSLEYKLIFGHSIKWLIFLFFSGVQPRKIICILPKPHFLSKRHANEHTQPSPSALFSKQAGPVTSHLWSRWETHPSKYCATSPHSHTHPLIKSTNPDCRHFWFTSLAIRAAAPQL